MDLSTQPLLPQALLFLSFPATFRGGSNKGTDAKYFSDRTVRKGENLELREELRSPKLDKKRDAVKKVSVSHTTAAHI